MKAIDLIRVALAIETLAYYDKNYLDRALASSDARINETVQSLLREAEVALHREAAGR